MTALLEPATAAPSLDRQEVRFASWPKRACALLTDLLPGVAVFATAALLASTAPQRGWLWWVFTAVAAMAFLATVVNRTLVPALTGWTVGRAVCGIRVVGRTDASAGALRLLLRDVAHVLDTLALLIGWLWPLWDKRNRTFADLLLRTEARVVDAQDRAARRRAGRVFVIAAGICVALSGLAYQEVYRQDRAIEQARSQIAERGPRIVEQMLSYGQSTAKEDFERAQGLATEGYRPELIAQQDSVEKTGVVTNEYWAVSSAVLTNSATQGTMLLALQGQRGDDPQRSRFITATVRVTFDKTGDDRWQVANLTVLKKPQMNLATG